MISVLVTFAIVVGLALSAIGIYNRLVRLRNQVQNGWRQIDVQLKRRHDLIPNLVSTVRGAMDFERDTLEAVVSARNRATTATGPADAAVKESEVSQTLGRLFAVVENYPQLTANQSVSGLQEELTTTENEVSFARQFYNDVVTKYNTATQVIPGNLVAGFGNFPQAELFEIKKEDERALPKVDLA